MIVVAVGVVTTENISVKFGWRWWIVFVLILLVHVMVLVRNGRWVRRVISGGEDVMNGSAVNPVICIGPNSDHAADPIQGHATGSHQTGDQQSTGHVRRDVETVDTMDQDQQNTGK